MNSKKNPHLIKRQPEPKHHLALFQLERKTLTQRRANSGNGDYSEAKKVRYLNKLARAGSSAGNFLLANLFPLTRHFPP